MSAGLADAVTEAAARALIGAGNGTRVPGGTLVRQGLVVFRILRVNRSPSTVSW